MKLRHIVIVAAALGLTAGAFASQRVCMSQHGNCGWDKGKGVVISTNPHQTLTVQQFRRVASALGGVPIEASDVEFNRKLKATDVQRLRVSCPNCIISSDQLADGVNLRQAQNGPLSPH